MKQNHGNEKGIEPTDSSSDDAKSPAANRLIEFLDEIHATLPEVPELDAQEAIEEAIAAIRNQPKG